MRAAVILKKALKSQGKCFLSRVCVQGLLKVDVARSGHADFRHSECFREFQMEWPPPGWQAETTGIPQGSPVPGLWIQALRDGPLRTQPQVRVRD